MKKEFIFLDSDIENGKVFALISYFGIIGILIAYLAGGKDNKFVLYHIQQSVGLTIALIVILITQLIIALIPFIGFILNLFLAIFIDIPIAILFIIGLINGFTGKVQPLPAVGPMFYKLGFIKPGDYRNA